jgi:deoxyhypusine synthase
MISDKKSLRFISFVGAVVSTGLSGIIKDLKKNNLWDISITICGALDQDVAKHFSNYKEGSFTVDNGELADQHSHRFGNILVPMESYGPLIEEKMQ